jgi:hypothetical protein
MGRWTDSELEFLRAAILDGHTSRSIARALNRSVRSVARRAKGTALSCDHYVRPKAPHIIKLRLTKVSMEQLKAVAAELNMTETAAARMIVTSTVRDSWLVGQVCNPAVWLR